MKEEPQKPDDMDDDTWQMKRMMGFAGFKSTKNTKVPGNDRNYAVRRDKQMEARQYMNRQGGFNRPLSPSRG
jgi:U4/U6.U5 tri-snRNP-associated protein 3